MVLSMRTDIIDFLEKDILSRCQNPANQFGIGCYGHIESVAKNGTLLAHRFGADEEVVLIAAWLHDIASITDASLYELHHIHGAEMAGEILSRFDYPAEKIELVQACIKNHRGSVASTKLTREEQCVADADAISHFDQIPSLLYLAYVTKGLNLVEGKQFVRDKLERSFRKLSDESKRFYAGKYQAAIELLK